MALSPTILLHIQPFPIPHTQPPPSLPPTHITSESAPAEPRPSYYFPHQIHQQDSSVGEGSSWWIRMFEHLPKSTLMIQSHSNCNIILSRMCEGSFCNLSKVSFSMQRKNKKDQTHTPSFSSCCARQSLCLFSFENVLLKSIFEILSHHLSPLR